MNYFLVKIRYGKMCEDGVQRTVTEQFLVDALSFSECEARTIEEVKPYVSGDFSITYMNPYKVSESILGDGDRYFKAKLEYITLDEKNGREKKQGVFFLVQASTIDEAKDKITAEMKKTMIDYALVKIEETKIMDLFPYKSEENGEV